MKKIFYTLSVIGILFIVSPIFSLKGESYQIGLLVNDVKVSHNNGKNWNTAEVDMGLIEADTVKTGDASYCDIIMPERGNFRIIDNSLISISSLKKQIEAIKVKKGKALFNIAKKLGPDESFTVETTVAVAAVRGTQFVIDSDEQKVNVTVNKGKVLITRNVKLPADSNPDELKKFLEVEASENQTIELTMDENKALEDTLNRVKKNRAEMIKILADNHDQTQKKLKILKGNVNRLFDQLNKDIEIQGNDTNSIENNSNEDDTSEIIEKTKNKVK